jgi:hypothetical protein
MRINGRTLRPSTLVERRLLLSLGTIALHVPRSENPYRVARRIEQLVRKHEQEKAFLRQLTTKAKTPEPRPSPDLDLPVHTPIRESEDGPAV